MKTPALSLFWSSKKNSWMNIAELEALPLARGLQILLCAERAIAFLPINPLAAAGPPAGFFLFSSPSIIPTCGQNFGKKCVTLSFTQIWYHPCLVFIYSVLSKFYLFIRLFLCSLLE
jgi:hypothetical protein